MEPVGTHYKSQCKQIREGRLSRRVDGQVQTKAGLDVTLVLCLHIYIYIYISLSLSLCFFYLFIYLYIPTDTPIATNENSSRCSLGMQGR